VRYYEHNHVVGFQETNLLGNVYYTNPIAWQGRVRELFLRDHCPEILDQLNHDLALVTVHCSCDYLEELTAFDEVQIRMFLADLTQSRMTLRFELWRRRPGATEVLVARGEQQVVCMRRSDGLSEPIPVPDCLCQALQQYT
jgi:enediyne biosynthesis thioesterase